jgi:sugar lactone lactonase YvrE
MRSVSVVSRLARGRRVGRVGAASAVLAAALFAFMAQGASAAVPSYELSLFAGTGTAGAPTAGIATSSRLNTPVALALDSAGDLYIADYSNDEVEKVTPSGVLSVIAGNGTAGAPTPGVATSSHLDDPGGVAVDASGNVYITNLLACEVVKVTPAGILSIVVGNGACGTPVAGAATSTPIGEPWGIAFDSSGNLYISDQTKQVIEKVTPSGTLSIFAGIVGALGAPTPGPATSSHLDAPEGLATDSAGNLYVADYYNSVIEKITPSGTLSVMAGDGAYGTPTPGPATSSRLGSPYGVAADAAGDVYIADYDDSDIDEVTPDGTLSVIAGNGGFGTPTYGVPATSSELDGPEDIATTAAGRLYVADTYNSIVELLAPAAVTAGTTPPAITGTSTVGQTLTASTGTWNNDPVLYTYQWEDCDATGANCTAISGATSSSYATAASDIGHTIRVVVTAHNGGGSASQTSSASEPIVALATPAPTTKPQTVPSNKYTVASATAEPNGTIVVGVKVPSAGTIAMLGTHEDVSRATVASARLYPGHERFEWARTSGKAGAAGTVAITSHPDNDGRELLVRHRRYGWALHVAVWTTYTPAGGYPRSHETTVKVLSARHHR